MDLDPDWRLGRAKAEAAFRKFLERDSRVESEWLQAGADYLRAITQDFVCEFLPSFSINPEFDIECFHSAIEGTITSLWEREFGAQTFVLGFDYGMKNSALSENSTEGHF